MYSGGVVILSVGRNPILFSRSSLVVDGVRGWTGGGAVVGVVLA